MDGFQWEWPSVKYMKTHNQTGTSSILRELPFMLFLLQKHLRKRSRTTDDDHGFLSLLVGIRRCSRVSIFYKWRMRIQLTESLLDPLCRISMGSYKINRSGFRIWDRFDSKKYETIQFLLFTLFISLFGKSYCHLIVWMDNL